jgi:hypothetical protein
MSYRIWIPAFGTQVAMDLRVEKDKDQNTGFVVAQAFSATTNGRDDRNLASGGDWARESTCISDMFITDENINVFPHLSLLGCDAIANSRVEGPESRQRVGQCCGRVFDLDCTVSSGKLAQGPWNMKSDRHGSPL